MPKINPNAPGSVVTIFMTPNLHANIWYHSISDRVYFSLHRFSDRFFTIEFTKHVILLLPIFGRFYYALNV